MQVQAAKKDEERRDFILRGSMWKVLISISLPLVLYNGINHLFAFLDTVIASNISSQVVSTVSFVSQIHLMFTAVGSGLSIGGGILIARYFGAGDMVNVKKHISTVLFLALIISGILLLVFIPLAVPFLRLLRIPEELVADGAWYFTIQLSSLVCIFINTIFFSTEKSKGNTKIILYLNIMVLSIKLLLTLFFVYVLKTGMLMLAVASLIAHTSVTIIAVIRLTRKSNPFSFSVKAVDLSPKVIKPILFLSLPVFTEKFAFSFGKVIVNSMSAAYGSIAVGALGVSNKISALSTSPPDGVQEAETSIISQNLGNNNVPRAIAFFKKTLTFNLIFGIALFILMTVFKDAVIGLFARGDPVFAAEIEKIYRYERYAAVFLAVNTSVMGFLYGFGLTQVAMVINIARLFLFRIPPLWIIQRYTALDSSGVGLAMFISNALTGITAITVCFFVIRKMKKQQAASAEFVMGQV
ncbi:MATE family efflux transporter [Breznakiella homolactica]|uniref:MATE family efflux transporter n=1 Tax=Breznakiella homolactica TaxID=2798577 RepID=A0A7T7XQY2_9SPIR|nr:MATE family efflux transporter [Breznakiella homolactica]QQO10824.1 MATE family efflux transporter [Breznakiella homolactica]